jgi:spore germination protein (amino acid permease)
MENKNVQISPFLVFFLIHSIQIGVGVLGYQRIIAKSAGNDAWIAVLVAGAAVSLVIWLMYKLLDNTGKDLIGIHKELFGKWAGGMFSFIWIMYWMVMGAVVLRNYMEIVQVWMFPKINLYIFCLIFLFLVYYGVSAGFRIVTGICFLGVVIPFYLVLTFLFPLEHTEFRQLLPIWNHSFKEIGVASKDMIFSYLGFSTLLMYYPFIKHPRTSKKWAQLGHLLTVVLYAILMIITTAYYSEQQLSRQVWATLGMWKIVEMPFVERFEYIGITSWILVILPNICLFIWAAVKGITDLFPLRPNKVLMILLFTVYVICVTIQGREQINLITDWMSKLGLVLNFAYIPLLYVIWSLVTLIRKKRHENG